MPFAAVILLLDVIFVAHAAKTGRLCPWAYVILALPVVGAVAYVVVELVPEWMGSVRGQQAQKRIGNKLNPEKRYRALSDAVEIADTFANRVELAEECLALEKSEEAKRHFEVMLARPRGDEPAYMFGKARAEFGLGAAAAAIVTLDRLRQIFPSYQSADAHLIYARALEACGRNDEALQEYRALSEYFVGAEARVRYGLLLARLGREAESKAWLAEVLTQLRRAPAHVRKTQAEWIALAEKAARA